ncbi:MAG: NDP-sugar synthase [Candidatus Aenigmarchaeota archaeon]|nr:NDP-sugar synthase [Candidatus Aenigmarchaeota archaeon]
MPEVYNNVTAIAPLGGSGNRLLPLTIYTPKHLLPIANTTLFNGSLKAWARQGVRKFILGVTGYENRIQTYRFFGHGGRLEGDFPGIEFRYASYHDREYKDRGSADVFSWALNHYREETHGDDILLINGDNLSDTSLEDFYQFHKDKKALLSIAVKGLEPEDPRLKEFGTVVFDDKSMKVSRFVEKSPEPPSRFANSAILLFSPEIYDVLDSPGVRDLVMQLMASGKRFDIGANLIPYVVGMTSDVYAFPISGQWSDVGTPHSFRSTTNDILHGEYPHMVLDYHDNVGDSLVHRTTRNRIGDDRLKAQLKGRCIVGKDVDIGTNSVIRNSVLDDYCNIGSDVHIDGITTVFPFARIEDGARVANAIIGYNTIIGQRASLASGSVIADDLNIPAEFSIGVDWRVADNAHASKILDPENKYAVVGKLDEISAFAFRPEQR